MEIDLRRMFPKGSQSFLDANPLSSPSPTNQNPVQGSLVRPRRGHMNKTEAEYALILEHELGLNNIHRFEFEGITLRFAGVKYTPDFAVWGADGDPIREIKFIEIKGRYISGKFERAIERFRHARTYYPEFQFEMWQKTKDGWKQIL